MQTPSTEDNYLASKTYLLECWWILVQTEHLTIVPGKLSCQTQTGCYQILQTIMLGEHRRNLLDTEEQKLYIQDQAQTGLET